MNADSPTPPLPRSPSYRVTGRHLSRRAFLRGAGVALALPWLDAMRPAFAKTAPAAQGSAAPQRFVAMMYGLGFHGPNLIPRGVGADYEATPYLEMLQRHRRHFSIVSGLSHVDQNGANGHASSATWLTAAKHPGLPGFRNAISFDQFLVERLVPDVRFPSLVLGVGGDRSLSWTAGGVQIPAESSPSALFRRLFVAGTGTEVARQERELRRGRSILDAVGDAARRFEKSLGPRDREKMDQYLDAVRDVESRIARSESWARRPKPPVDAEPPRDVADRYDILAQTRLMHDLIALALRTDSTRIVTYAAGGFNPVPKIPGVSTGWHDLSHHGQDPAKIEELAVIERAEFGEIDRFLGLLRDASDERGPVLDRTTVLIGSNLGNASSHSWRDLPILVAGGPFRHGRHVVAGGAGLENARLSNLFVQIARQLGIDVDHFGSSDGTAVEGLSTMPAS